MYIAMIILEIYFPTTQHNELELESQLFFCLKISLIFIIESEISVMNQNYLPYMLEIDIHVL